MRCVIRRNKSSRFPTLFVKVNQSMKKRLLLPLLLLAACLSSSARASVYQGTVASVYPYQGMVYIVINNGAFGGAQTSCPVGVDGMVFVIDPTTAFGKVLMTTALSAKLTGKTVYATGDGNCGGWNPYNGKSNEGLIGMDLKG
jgi:hypothetical protein